MGQIEDKAIKNQVRHCGCRHCRHLVYHALGTPEAIEDFWNSKDVLAALKGGEGQ